MQLPPGICKALHMYTTLDSSRASECDAANTCPPLAGGGSAAAQGGQRHSTYAVDCTANANTVATGSTAGGVRVWDARSGQMTHDLQLHTGNVRAIQISADGQVREGEEGCMGVTRSIPIP